MQDPASKIMQGPPAMIYAGFEGGLSLSQKNLEQARTKFLVDKLTGKLPESRKDKPLMLAPLNLLKDTPKKGPKSVSSKSRADDEKEVKFAPGTSEDKAAGGKKGAHG
jgi:hypothetical protein